MVCSLGKIAGCALLYDTTLEVHLVASLQTTSLNLHAIVTTLSMRRPSTPVNARVVVVPVMIMSTEMQSLSMLSQLSLASNVCYTWVLAKLLTLALLSLSISSSSPPPASALLS